MLDIRSEINNRERKTFGQWFVYQFMNNRIFILMIVLMILLIFMAIFYSKTFFSVGNFSAVLLNLTTSGIMAVGMTYLIVGGVFDLSIGANLALGAAVAAYFMKSFTNIPIVLSVIIGISVSVFVGLLNGLIVTRLNVNALITTLGMMSICRSLAIVITGSGIANLPDGFKAFGQLVFFRLQVPVFYLIIITIIGYFLLKKTVLFRKIFYIGSNENAAILSGINVKNIMLVSFIIMGLLAGFTGMVVAARLNAAVGTMMPDINLQVITAVVLGGGSLSGGRGSVIGSFVGCLFMAIIRNIMVITGMSIYLQSGVIGLLLIVILGLDAIIAKKYGTIT